MNLAAVAEPSRSSVSGDTSLAALHDGYEPKNSRDRRRGSYGNWSRKGTQWVQYDWSRPISTRRIDVYWWDDNRGVRLPKACRLLYWDGKGFVAVGNPSGLGVAGNQYNTTTFAGVRTSRLRLEIDSNGNFSTGILEWKVYDTGQSPDFPPSVTAGVDRVVVLGGKTYLAGEFKTLAGKAGASTGVTWSKASGPGKVAFADAKASATTATLSAAGDYVLKLTAGKGRLSASSTLAVKVVPPPSDGITSVALNGSSITPPIDKGYAVITRNWKAGDRIDLVLPMKIQRIKGIGKIAATRGQVALRYGPLIYNAESVDQDPDKVLTPGSPLKTEWRGDLLGGVMVIKGA